jgi:hypothetical protein
MSIKNRLRCTVCGTCFEGHSVSEKDSLACQICGNPMPLVEEDPEGMASGALPPVQRCTLLGVTALFVLLAYFAPLFAVPAFVALLWLAVDIVLGHRKQRAEKIAMWDRLQRAFTTAKDSKASTAKVADLENALAMEHARYQQDVSTLRQDRDYISDKLTGLQARYEAISPEKKTALESEILELQKILGVLKSIEELRAEKAELGEQAKALKQKLITLEEEELLQSFGFYKPLYDCADSSAYKVLLDRARDKQKSMVKDKTALRVEGVFAVDDDKSAGKRISKNLEKLIIRSFNSECDEIIDKVTFSNIDAISARIRKAAQDLNDLCSIVGISITQAYVNVKLEELSICHEFRLKQKEEKEEQRRIRERMREDARVEKEIQDAKEKIEKEETHFNQIMADLRERMDSAAASERAQYEKKLAEYELKLAAVEKDKEEVQFRAQSTRAGYVYIISNLGSFGEDVFKVGVTRRLDPQERIDELGDASVPFEFDIHALIFSEDAPRLEGALHEHFADRAINKVNPRKEFFKVTLSEIEQVVKDHHNATVEFTRIAKAEDFRRSLVQASIAR